jgi:Txe/YoeB family toxin of Txe-Axe toxin-antitoxin module
MATYNTYIELSPHYESVVDLNSEKRNPNLWQEYIVHEDMKLAVEKICQSIKYEKEDARRSFWIHGAYGTGKSYAAIVLKHLFEDTVTNVHSFLSKQLLLPYRNQFVALREKGEYLVVWKSGCTGIKSGIHLMMEMEMAIRQKLKTKFGENAYYGRKSLIACVQELINDESINWENIFNDPVYSLWEDYTSFSEFRGYIMENDLKATETVAKIIMEKGWGLFHSVGQFEDWIKDIIEGNGLQQTGIVFIWDEFTSFLRDCGDDNVLQRLSEYCKQQPFFMFLIVHRDPGWVDALGSETYERILHRYHELEFHISESAAYKLIGDSILTRPGMEEQWNDIKNQLMQSISKNIADFDNLDIGNKQESLKQLCPMHPMTLSLLTIVAQNFGAEQRTLFRFMKDPEEVKQRVGFIHYINNFGPNDWRWLTPDFLWDYFFTRESDIRDFSPEARRCYQYYINKKELVNSDEIALRVFKTVLLLIAVMSTEKISQLRSQSYGRRIAATLRTLYKCFAGQLDEKDVDSYMEAFEDIGVFRLDRQPNGDARLELPYTGKANIFDIRLEQTKRKYTRYKLFRKDGVFAKAIESKMWDATRATYKRMSIIACSSETNSWKNRLEELRNELNKSPYKIGILVFVTAENKEYAIMQSQLKEIAEQDQTQRLIVCMVKEPLKSDVLDRWHRAITHNELAGEEGKRGSAAEYENKAAAIVGEWAVTAADGQITAFYGGNHYSVLFGKDELTRRVENDIIFKLFPAAPERVVTVNTAFKKARESAATAAITCCTSSNAQINNIANGIKVANIWGTNSIEELEQCDTTPGARAVASLAQFLHRNLSHGAKIKLDHLWMELQQPPFGYYDSLACAYLLGYVLRFYINGEFNWVDSANNPNYLTEKNLATMIVNMCKGQVTNNTLSSGSETWQQFRNYAQKIFNLSDQESASEEQARKYMRERIISAGAPFWVLKYVSAEKFGGDETQVVAQQIVDKMCTFITGEGDQEEVMGGIISLFKGRGLIRQIITETFSNNADRYAAFKTFIIESEPRIGELIDFIGINSNELFDSIKVLMQGAIYTWTEEQVKEKLGELACDYELINTLNMAMNVQRKTINQLRQDLHNSFEHMKVPGTVIENFDKPWVLALKCMYKIALDEWSSLSGQQKNEQLEVLKANAKDAWGYINSSKLLLSEYMRQQNIYYTGEEIESVFSDLKLVPYNSPEVTFRSAIQTQIDNISYERNKNVLLKLWEEKSSTTSISDWSKKNNTPIQWVVKEENLPYFRTIKSLQDGKCVDKTELYNALKFLEQNELFFLKNSSYIKDCFFRQVGENYRELFESDGEAILARIRLKLKIDVNVWAHNAGLIRDIVEDFAREKLKAKNEERAKKNIMRMSEDELRRRIIALLSDNPEFYKRFIDEVERK